MRLPLIYNLASGSGFECESDINYAMSSSAEATRWVPALQIRWQESDLIYLETHPLSPGVVPEIPETITTGPGPTDTRTILPNSDEGLSKGAVAGISIGALVGALLIVGAAFLLWRRRKKPSPGSSEATAAASAPFMQGPQMYGQMQVPQQPYYQMAAPAQQTYPNVSPGQKHLSHMSDYSSTPPSAYYPPQMAYLPPGVPPTLTPASSTSPSNATPQAASAVAEVPATQPAAEPTELSSVPFPRDNQHIPDWVSHGGR